jgi:hypothetical protein
MRQFLKNIGVFLLPLMLLFPLDSALTRVLWPYLNDGDEVGVWDEILSDRAGCKIAIYGSSRAWMHINPAIIEDSTALPAYNFGIDGHNFWLQELRHLKVMEMSTTPDIIIHSVDVFTLEKRPKLYNKEQFMPFMLWDFEVYRYTKTYQGYQMADYFLPLVRYRNLTTYRFNDENLNTIKRNKGFFGLQRTWNGDLEQARSKWGNYTVQFDQETLVHYNEFLLDCNRRGIKVIMVYTPEYTEGQSFVLNRNEVIEKFRAFASAHNIPFLDYSDCRLSHEKDNFFNTSHLNNNGAERFSRMLAHDLKKYI